MRPLLQAAVAIGIGLGIAGPGPAAEADGERQGRQGRQEAPFLSIAKVRASCDTIHNTHRCARAIERRQLVTGPSFVRRAGDTLTLGLSAGDSVRLVDGDCCEGNPLSYSFIGYLEPIRRYVVHGQYYEGDTHLLIHRTTGRSVSAWALPVPSPAFERVVSASADIEAGYNRNGFQVWRVKEDGTLEPEFELEPSAWGPTEPEWLD